MTAFELRIWPGPGVSPGSTSSSPVGTIETRGRGMTWSVALPDRSQYAELSRMKHAIPAQNHFTGAHLRPAQAGHSARV